MDREREHLQTRGEILVDRRRDDVRAAAGLVLCVVGVEVVAVRDDLDDRKRLLAEHAARELAARDVLFGEDLRVRFDASSIAFVHSSCVRTIATPAREPSKRGFTTSGRSSDPGKQRQRSAGEIEEIPGRRRQALGGEQLLGEVLVHRERAASRSLPVYGIPSHSRSA